jgi:hypothetical protein
MERLTALANLEVLRLRGMAGQPRLLFFTRLRKLEASVVTEPEDLLTLSHLTSLTLGYQSIVSGPLLAQLTRLRHLDIINSPQAPYDLITLTNLRALLLCEKNDQNLSYLEEHLPLCNVSSV